MADKPTQQFPRRFVFHGNAVAAEVFLTRIGDSQGYRVNPVDGQSSLPVIGGHSESTVPRPEIPSELADVFAYGECHTMADGRFNDDGVAVTIVECSVNGARVVNQPSKGEGEGPSIFTLGAVSLAIQSVHPLKGEPSIDFMRRPTFQDLSLDGLPIELELDDDLVGGLGRYCDLEKRFRTDSKFFERCRDSFACFGRKRPLAFGERIPRRGPYALCSFVRSIRWGEQVIPGHVLTRPGFGSLYFGEILLNDRERRVTMVRIQLGSKNGGQASFGEAAPNGTWIPPRR